MKKIFAMTSIGMLSASLLAGNRVDAQHAPASSSATLPATPSQISELIQDYSVAEGQYNIAVAGFPGDESQNAVNKALKAMKDAEDDASRQQAEGELKSALEADYDARLEGYEKHLDNLEAELAKMREQLKKRRAAKSEMVELRLQVLQAEADDLGWPNEFGSRGVHRFFGTRSVNPFGSVWTTGTSSSVLPPAEPVAPVAPVAPAVRARGGR